MVLNVGAIRLSQNFIHPARKLIGAERQVGRIGKRRIYERLVRIVVIQWEKPKSRAELAGFDQNRSSRHMRCITNECLHEIQLDRPRIVSARLIGEI
jgi:hypothetical protein